MDSLIYYFFKDCKYESYLTFADAHRGDHEDRNNNIINYNTIIIVK